MLEKFACDRINYILFSLEHVIKMGEEKMSSKRRVCVMHVFNQGKEGLVGKKGLPSHCCRIFFYFIFFYTDKWRKPAVKCEQTSFSGLALCPLVVQFLEL